MTMKGIGTVISRRSTRGRREYWQTWLYIPSKVVGDSAFPLKSGSPFQVEINNKKGQLIITPISVEEAQREGWTKRQRRPSANQ